MSYKFSGLAGSQALRSDIGITWPATHPYTIAGWSRNDSFLVNSTVLCPAIDADANGIRIQMDWETTRWGGFLKATTVTQQQITITYPSWITTRDWAFMAYVLRSDTDKQLYVVCRGCLFESAIGTTSMGIPVFNRITFGYLPFFGNLQDMQGSIGPHGIWNRQLTPPEIMRMGRGAPITNYSNGLYAYWNMDGRIVNQPVLDTRYKMPLTVTGPPAYDLNGPPIIQRPTLIGNAITPPPSTGEPDQYYRMLRL